MKLLGLALIKYRRRNVLESDTSGVQGSHSLRARSHAPSRFRDFNY